jgi:hypothetical protein
LWIARCFEISSLNRCVAPDSHDRRARFVALSAISDKLSSRYEDSGMKASLSSPRAVFKFLALAVRRWLNRICFECWDAMQEAGCRSQPPHHDPVPVFELNVTFSSMAKHSLSIRDTSASFSDDSASRCREVGKPQVSYGHLPK